MCIFFGSSLVVLKGNTDPFIPDWFSLLPHVACGSDWLWAPTLPCSFSNTTNQMFPLEPLLWIHQNPANNFWENFLDSLSKFTLLIVTTLPASLLGKLASIISHRPILGLLILWRRHPARQQPLLTSILQLIFFMTPQINNPRCLLIAYGSRINSLAVQWLRLCAFTAGVTGSIPGRGTKIPHATWHGQKNPKKQKKEE